MDDTNGVIREESQVIGHHRQTDSADGNTPPPPPPPSVMSHEGNVDAHRGGSVGRVYETVELEIQEIDAVSSSSSSSVGEEQTNGASNETPSANCAASSPLPQEQSNRSSDQVEAGDTRIKLKFLDDTQRMVVAWLSQTVGEFKRYANI